MTNGNLFGLLYRHFSTNLAAPALAVPGGDTLSYGQLDDLSARIAGVLRGLDIATGERIVVQVEKSISAVALYLACLRVGAVYVPLNTAYTAGEVAYFVGDAAPALLVCAPGVAQRLIDAAGAPPGLRCLTMDRTGAGSVREHAAVTAPSPEVAEVAADDLAAILYTSGTTGRSKGAMLSHGNLAANALTLHEIWGWRTGDVLIHALPIFHVHGLFVAIHCALLNGSKIWFLAKFDADAVVALLPHSTILMGVPTFYTRLLDHPGLTHEACASMRLFIAGSAPLLAETFEAFARQSGHRILERYGMTETGMITSNPLDGARVPATVGYALPDVEIRIADEAGRILDAGQVGVLELIGPNVFGGYC